VDVITQADEVLTRFDLHDSIAPFDRCLVCNGLLNPVDKNAILGKLEPKTRLYYQDFHLCHDCGQIYWRGSHSEHMMQRYAQFLTAK
jgi:uncharacterized protein with PIN domain